MPKPPLFPHTPKKKEPLFLHVPKGQRVERLPQTVPEGRCKKCGRKYYGWALKSPEHRVCECSGEIEITYLPQSLPQTEPWSRYKVGDRVKSKVWTDARGGHPWLTVTGIYTAEWMGLPKQELEVTDGLQTNRIFEDTIIGHEPGRRGKPRTDIERAMAHYGISEAEYLAHPERYPLPERGSGQQRQPATKLMGDFILNQDRMGNIIITYTLDVGKSVFLQFDADKELVYDILTEEEREDLDAGWRIEIRDDEPRATMLQELWEVSAQAEPSPSVQFLPQIVDRVRDYPTLEELTKEVCYDFRAVRSTVMRRAWEIMDTEKVRFRDAIKRAWDEVKRQCWKLGAVI